MVERAIVAVQIIGATAAVVVALWAVFTPSPASTVTATTNTQA